MAKPIEKTRTLETRIKNLQAYEADFKEIYALLKNNFTEVEIKNEHYVFDNIEDFINHKNTEGFKIWATKASDNKWLAAEEITIEKREFLTSYIRVEYKSRNPKECPRQFVYDDVVKILKKRESRLVTLIYHPFIFFFLAPMLSMFLAIAAHKKIITFDHALPLFIAILIYLILTFRPKKIRFRIMASNEPYPLQFLKRKGDDLIVQLITGLISFGLGYYFGHK